MKNKLVIIGLMLSGAGILSAKTHVQDAHLDHDSEAQIIDEKVHIKFTVDSKFTEPKRQLYIPAELLIGKTNGNDIDYEEPGEGTERGSYKLSLVLPPNSDEVDIKREGDEFERTSVNAYLARKYKTSSFEGQVEALIRKYCAEGDEEREAPCKEVIALLEEAAQARVKKAEEIRLAAEAAKKAEEAKAAAAEAVVKEEAPVAPTSEEPVVKEEAPVAPTSEEPVKKEETTEAVAAESAATEEPAVKEEAPVAPTSEESATPEDALEEVVEETQP